MRIGRTALYFPALLLAACQDYGITTSNDTPEVSILAPTEGQRVVFGESLTITATVSDESATEDLALTWSTADGPLAGAETRDGDDHNRLQVKSAK